MKKNATNNNVNENVNNVNNSSVSEVSVTPATPKTWEQLTEEERKEVPIINLDKFFEESGGDRNKKDISFGKVLKTIGESEEVTQLTIEYVTNLEKVFAKKLAEKGIDTKTYRVGFASRLEEEEKVKFTSSLVSSSLVRSSWGEWGKAKNLVLSSLNSVITREIAKIPKLLEDYGAGDMYRLSVSHVSDFLCSLLYKERGERIDILTLEEGAKTLKKIKDKERGENKTKRNAMFSY